MLKWVSEWISKSDKIDWLIDWLITRSVGANEEASRSGLNVEVEVGEDGWLAFVWELHATYSDTVVLFFSVRHLWLSNWNGVLLRTSLFMNMRVCVNSIPRSFYSTRISLFVYYTFDFPPNWLATHVMSCPCCLVFVLLVVGAPLKLVADGQNS